MNHTRILFLSVLSMISFPLGAQQIDWDSQGMTARTEHQMAYDEARQRTVLFGGFVERPSSIGTLTRTADTWEFDGTSWHQRAPNTAPSARSRAAMTYDSARRNVVLFGGTIPSGPDNATWTYDGTNWARQSPVVAPPARARHSLVYDRGRRKVVLFGGIGLAPLPLNDTWEWDGNTWTQVNTSGAPSPRMDHAMAYDATHQRVILFGGTNTVPYTTTYSDTWEWDGTSWNQRLPTVIPQTRSSHTMAYDASRKRVVMFGGNGGMIGSAWLSDTWEWDGDDWVRPSSQANPTGRNLHQMVYDAGRRKTVLFGGMGLNDVTYRTTYYLGDTWEWDGSDWIEVRSYPPRRSGSVMVYDAGRHRAVLFGGTPSGVFYPRPPHLDDTWECMGRTWSPRNPIVSPPGRAFHSMAYDSARQRVVLFGGQSAIDVLSILSDTWEWDGTLWRRLRPLTSPPARAGHAMCYDESRKKVVLFGGDSNKELGDTWEWDGTSWTQRSPSQSPNARSAHSMAYDASRQRVVLFGGASGKSFQPLSDTWEWDGSNWNQRSSTTAPPGRQGSAMAYDSRNQQIILYGGFAFPQLLSDAWSWNGITWTQITTATKGILRTGHAMAYDTDRHCAVVYGGVANTLATWSSDTWVLGLPRSASSQPFGTACLGNAGSRCGITSNEPYLGNDRLSIELLSDASRVPCVFGLSPTTQNLSLGGGCSLYLNNPFLTIFGNTSATGNAAVEFSIPFDPSLRGGVAYAQAAFVDPLSPVLGLAFTQGLALTFGF